MLHSWLPCVIQAFVVIRAIVHSFCLSCFLLFLVLLDCWFCDIFLSFLDAGFWRTTNSRDPSLPHCPRFQISRPCKLPRTFLYLWPLLLLWLLDTFGDFVLFVSPTFLLYCAYQRNFLLCCFLVTYVLLVMNVCLFLWNRDLAQNKLTGDIPRLIYWNEVLQYL